jgi:hypothetical protein
MARRAKLTPHEEFYAAVGQFVVEWAGMELALDLLLLVTSRKPDKQGRLPHELESKIKHIKKHTEYIDDYHRNVTEELLEEIKGYANTRHDLVHGAIIHHVVNESGITATLGRMLQPESQPRQNPVKVTAREIIGTSEKIHALGDRLLHIAAALLEIRKN